MKRVFCNPMLLFYIWGGGNMEVMYHLKELREIDDPNDIEKDDIAFEKYQKELRAVFSEQLKEYENDKKEYKLSEWNHELSRMTLLREIKEEQYANKKTDEALEDLLLTEAQYFFAKEKAIEAYDEENPEDNTIIEPAATNENNIYTGLSQYG